MNDVALKDQCLLTVFPQLANDAHVSENNGFSSSGEYTYRYIGKDGPHCEEESPWILSQYVILRTKGPDDASEKQMRERDKWSCDFLEC